MNKFNYLFKLEHIFYHPKFDRAKKNLFFSNKKMGFIKLLFFFQKKYI